MKALQLGEQTGLGSLHMADKPDPVAGPGEAVLKVRLACLNNRDIQILEGRYGAKKAADRVPFSEGVGEVVSLGEGATGVEIGDRAVLAHFFQWGDDPFDMRYFGADLGTSFDGWGAEYIKVPASALVKVPDTMTDEQVAPLASASVTAWHALVEVGQVKAGDLVLALGTGGVAMAALQIAKANGALFAVTSSSDEKLAKAKEMGADFTVNYAKHPDWPAELMKLTGGRGADIIAETGGQHTLPMSINAAATHARIVVIGAGAGEGPLPNYGLIIAKNLVIKGIAAGGKGMMQRLIKAMAANDLAPVIDREFPFAQAGEALEYLKGASHMGKVMLRF